MKTFHRSAGFFSVIFFLLAISNASLLSADGFYVVSADPANGASGVDPAATFSITFSKPIDPTVTFEYPEGFFINLSLEPDSLAGEPDSVTIDPSMTTVRIHNLHLISNQQYLVIIVNAVSADGDSLDSPFVSTFTTGGSLPSASVAGQVQLPEGVNPAGTLVMLYNGHLFSDEVVVSAGVADSLGNYMISYVPAGVLWPVALKGAKVDVDGDLLPADISWAGVYDSNGDLWQDSLMVGEGDSLNSIDISLSKLEHVTARQNIEDITNIATAWNADAALTSLMSFDVDSLGYSMFWVYQYYSETADTFQVYMMMGDLIVPADPVDMPVNSTRLLPENWIDSDVVIDSANVHGGAAYREQHGDSTMVAMFLSSVFPFDIGDDSEADAAKLISNKALLEHVPEKVVLDLARRVEMATPYWFVFYSVEEDESDGKFPFIIIVDATTGEVYDRVTARQAEAAAAVAASEWAADAQLLGVASIGFGDIMGIDGKATVWLCLYHSAVLDSARAFITFNRLVIGSQRGITLPVPIISGIPDNWIDSDSVMAIAEINGGEAYRTNNPGTTISAVLATGLYMNNPLLTVWQVMYESYQADMLTITIDAFTGEVLSEGAVTAADAYLAARDTALNWENDAVLTGIETAPAENINYAGMAEFWHVTFYSASLNRSYHVYTQGHDIILTLPFIELNELKKQALVDGWIDSDSAATIAEQNGGVIFRLMNAPVNVTAELGRDLLPSDPSLAVWTFHYMAENDTLNVYIDAYSGEKMYTNIAMFNDLYRPADYMLEQNYPNPFNPETEIRYALPEAGNVNLRIYNLLGQVVAQLVDAYQPVGRYRVRWNGRDAKEQAVPSGIYLCRLESGKFRAVIKMTLLR